MSEQLTEDVTQETVLSTQVESKDLTMWNDPNVLQRSWKAAKMLASSDLVPRTYKKPENCLIALDVAGRIGWSPLAVMQNLNIVHGNPAWSGQACIAMINGCGRFMPLQFKFSGEKGKDNWQCIASTTRVCDGAECTSSPVTWKMAKDEGWVDRKDKEGKPCSKWLTIPEQMMMYRAGAFFARVYCPDVLQGIYIREEIEDVYGQEIQEKTTVKIQSQND